MCTLSNTAIQSALQMESVWCNLVQMESIWMAASQHVEHRPEAAISLWTEQAVLILMYTAKVGTSWTICNPHILKRHLPMYLGQGHKVVGVSTCPVLRQRAGRTARHAIEFVCAGLRKARLGISGWQAAVRCWRPDGSNPLAWGTGVWVHSPLCFRGSPECITGSYAAGETDVSPASLLGMTCAWS